MLNTLPKLLTKKRKRVGAGWGSGKGKYSGRGRKGQKARSKVKLLFEGGQNVLYKKLPKLRGKLRNKSINLKSLIVKLSALENNSKVKNNTVIDTAFLVTSGFFEQKALNHRTVKILGGGKLTKKIIVKVNASKKAIEQIKKSGGEYQN